MADINVTEEIIDINVTEEVVNIIAPSGGYPLPNAVNSVFGRVGNIVAIEGDYTLTQLGDVTLTSPSNGQVLKYNGTQWVNSTDADTGITTLNTLTALSQTFATGSSGTDFNISSATSTHTFNFPTASATNRGLLSSADWSTFNAKQNALTNPVTGTGTTNNLPKFTGASAIGNSNVTDSGTLITLGSNTQISSGALGIGTFPSVGYSLLVGKNITGTTTSFGVYQFGTVQSDVTTTANGFYNQVNTQAASFSLNYNHFLAVQGTIGAGSTITTQTAFNVASNLIGGTNNYGFRGQIPSGTNRWNLYMDGTANNYMAGGLVIGSTTLSGVSFRNSKLITGATTYSANSSDATILSDVTTLVRYYDSFAQLQNTAFTLQNIVHYFANAASSFGSASVTTQTGFLANAGLIGATNNYGFRGQIPVGTNRWNLYMDGMGANFLAGDTGIGTPTLGTATQLTIGGTETAVSAISRGQLINTTLVASANGDTLVGLDIAPTFTNGAFTGVTNAALRLGGNLAFANQNFNITSNNVTRLSYNGGVGLTFSTSDSTTPIRFVVNSFNESLRIFAATGNILLQNGGTFTDAGFRLDVNGTTRFIGTASSDTAPLGAELAAVTGTGTNWTLAGTNLNVGGYTHTVGSTAPLTTALAAVNFTYYQIAYTITGRTTGSITIDYGGTSTSGITATGNTGPLASSTAVLTITPTTDFNGTVVLSIRSISTSSASSTFANSASTSNIEVRASNITSNTFIGLSNGRRNTTGANNTFIGQFTGISNTTGAGNTIIGAFAGQSNTIAFDNTFVGTNTGANNTASLNTFLGANAGAFNTTGISNTFVGRAAGQSNTTGSSNVMFGQNAGRFITGGSTANTISNNSIFIGDNTRAAADSQTNQIVIGHNTTGLGSNTTIIGNSVTTITGLYGNIRLVSGMGTAPASATATGTTGDIVVTAGFIYVCTATNTWVRTALTTW